ncbi:hypothetical protein D3C76_471010 [compost metagenome]
MIFVPAPSIMDRLVAALDDNHPCQTVFYNRREGAASSIIELLKGKEDMLVICTEGQFRFYRESGVKFGHHNELLKIKPLSLHGIRTVVFDVVPVRHLKELRLAVLSRGCKLIVVKPIIRGNQ